MGWHDIQGTKTRSSDRIANSTLVMHLSLIGALHSHAAPLSSQPRTEFDREVRLTSVIEPEVEEHDASARAPRNLLASRAGRGVGVRCVVGGWSDRARTEL
jgi:hypothetical protein